MSDSKNFSLNTFFDIYRGLPCLYTAGEFALASSPLFREHRLRLYRQQTSLINRSDRQYITESYLIVKGRTPVMRLQTDFNHIPSFKERDKPGFLDHSEPGQPPVYLIPALAMRDGWVHGPLSALESLLQEPGAPDWPDCTYIQLPVAIHHAMVDLCMIRMTQAPLIDHIWLSTDYGASLGLTDGYMIRDDGQLYHTLFIPAERRMELYRALIWPRTRWEGSQSIMSLEQRLEKTRQGLLCSNAIAVDLVRAFGATPLADYMASYPEYFEELRQKFGEMATFQEAADRVFQFCMVYHTPEDCGEYIACLLLPLLSIYDGSAPVNQATQPVQKLLHHLFPSLLMGAAMAAGQPCLLRNTQLILNGLLEGKADKLQTTCWTLFRTCGPDERIVLLFRLFIEPFALLNQALKPCR